MKATMVRYRVKADKAAENETYIKAVFDQLNREKPEGLHYASFKMDDGVSFVHLAWYDAGVERTALVDLSTFKEFTAGIQDRCEEPPVTAALHEISSYSVFGELASLGGKA